MLNTVINLIVHVSFLLCVGMIVVVVRRCARSPMRSTFLVMLGIMVLWNLGTFLEFDFRMVTGVTYMPFIYISYIGICAVPVVIFCLGKISFQPEWKPAPVHAWFLLIPVISIIMVTTYPLHNLFFVEFSLNSSEAVYGAYYYFHSAYSYGCITAGIVLMLVSTTRNSGLFSKQSLLVILGIVVTAVPNMLYSFNIVEDLPFGVSAAGFTASLICFALAFLKYRFITALPISLRQVVDLISDGYLVVDKQLCILSYNKALLNLFPEPHNITLGDNLRAFVERYFLDMTYESFCELQAQSAEGHGETVSAEAHILKGSYVRVEITPVIQHRAQVGSIILFKDITQSRLLIEATQAASQAKSDFLSHMSHEIRTPLNAIIGMISIGINSDDIEKKNYCFDRADSASKHLLSLINDILDMSKIEAEKFELSYNEFDFEKMLMNITNVANVRAEEKQQAFVVNLGGSVPAYIEGDDLRLSQVITNLLTNAIKFTPEKGSVILSIEEIERSDDDEIVLRVEVADSGIGISPEQQAQLFTSFNQADTNITKKFGGTGLGLAISKKIVELMDGRIWIESELGKGAKFIFEIRAKIAEGKPHTKLSANMGMENVNILAVDNSFEVRAYFLRIMDTLKLSGNVAEDGAEALNMAENAEEAYNVFFVDWNMPEMNGIELARKIKEINEKSSIVMMVSAADWSLIEKEAVAAGVNHFISKPIFPSELINSINICMGKEIKTSVPNGTEQLGGRYNFNGHTLLIAEDIEINREIMGALLEETEIAIDYAENGRIAVSLFEESPDKYGLILMDVNMPEMDGYEATRAIRALDAERAGNIPIIAMTANVFKEDIDRCLESGMNGHTGKPVDMDALLMMLDEYLNAPNRMRE